MCTFLSYTVLFVLDLKSSKTGAQILQIRKKNVSQFLDSTNHTSSDSSPSILYILEQLSRESPDTQSPTMLFSDLDFPPGQ